jgi:hypothetical protein
LFFEEDLPSRPVEGEKVIVPPTCTDGIFNVVERSPVPISCPDNKDWSRTQILVFQNFNLIRNFTNKKILKD